MPFDVPHALPPRSLAPSRAGPRSTRPVAIWLFVLAAMILVMVTLGGATRLTGSGLSIMEWAPLMGALPPLSDAEWHRLYAIYQQIPQYALVNQGFGLDGFKGIFWLEWTHRLWGRLMGLVLLAPLVWFALRGQVSRRLVGRLAVLFVLGAAQGLVGWLMVASGFDADRTAVSPYRLVAHLSLALALYAAVLWTALDQWPSATSPAAPSPSAPSPSATSPSATSPGAAAPTDRLLRRLTHATTGAAVLTMLAGGFVAGLKAGLTYNTFPLMDGHLVPEGYAQITPWWRNLFENVAAVQFDHRLLATLTAVLAAATVLRGLRHAAGPVRIATLALGAAVAAQYTLGVLTLVHAVPVPLGVAHQAVATLVLTAALVLLHLQPRRPANLAPARPPAHAQASCIPPRDVR